MDWNRDEGGLIQSKLLMFLEWLFFDKIANAIKMNAKLVFSVKIAISVSNSIKSIKNWNKSNTK